MLNYPYHTRRGQHVRTSKKLSSRAGSLLMISSLTYTVQLLIVITQHYKPSLISPSSDLCPITWLHSVVISPLLDYKSIDPTRNVYSTISWLDVF